MCAREHVTLALLPLAVVLVLAGCSPSASPPSAQPALPQGPDAKWDVVVIGDSSMWGLGDALASQIEEDVGVKVARHDWIEGGYSAGDLLQALQTGDAGSLERKGLPQRLKEAEFVVMWANPNDSVMPDNPLELSACLGIGTPRNCSPDSFEQYTADLEAIWAEILELRDGQPIILRATDLYNPRAVVWKEHGMFEACTPCWENLSNAVRLAAEAYNIPFVSRYDAYNGANHDEDPRKKGYIHSDGIHPSKLGAEYTADLLSEMGYEPVTPP